MHARREGYLKGLERTSALACWQIRGYHKNIIIVIVAKLPVRVLPEIVVPSWLRMYRVEQRVTCRRLDHATEHRRERGCYSIRETLPCIPDKTGTARPQKKRPTSKGAWPTRLSGTNDGHPAAPLLA